MNNHMQAIDNVVSKRIERGSTKQDTVNYLKGLLYTWKNNSTMTEFIANKIEKVGN